jgi:peptidyl-prolyl cis-trans isomerase B (cyclophilin B)
MGVRGLKPLLLLALVFVVGLSLSACSSPKSPSKKPAAKFNQPPVLEVIGAYVAEHPVDKADPGWKTNVPRPPVVKFNPSKSYYWYLYTSEGALKIELEPKWAPRRVAATIYLTEIGFYDGLTFHRVIPKFMAQGGDPLGTGAGGPGFNYPSEINRKARHSKRGVVSMANAGPRSEGSQFFILFDAAENLDEKHTVFGKVVEGFGTLRALENYGSESGEPRKVVTIKRAEIRVE